jgi:tripartite-type tricarboxylate transporter receptor subunit TctC
MKNRKTILFRTFITSLALSFVVVLSVVSSAPAATDSYPTKSIRLIVPTAPGGSSDIVARIVAIKLSQRLGKTVVVENHGGAGSTIGTEIVAKANPDGYTLLAINNTHTTQPSLQKLPYDTKTAFTPISKLGSGLLALVVHPSVQANSVKEFIALAKQKPGQLAFATAGSGSLIHMVHALFMTSADIDCKMVQFKGAGPAVTDLLGGHSHAMVGTIPSILAHIKSGKLKVLGTSGLKRSPLMPDVPSIAEDLPGFEATIWWGFLAPAGVPAPIVDRLNKEIKEIVATDEVKNMFLKDGASVDYQNSTEFGKFLEKEIDQWERVIKKAKIQLE